MSIEFKDPPKNAHAGAPLSQRWMAVAEELRSRPGEWALVAEDATSATVTQIKNGRIRAFTPSGSFEATGRGDGSKGSRVTIYARYIGGDPS